MIMLALVKTTHRTQNFPGGNITSTRDATDVRRQKMPLLALVAKFFWPLSNIFAIIAAPEKPTDSVSATKKNPAQPIANSVEDHAAVQVSNTTRTCGLPLDYLDYLLACLHNRRCNHTKTRYLLVRIFGPQLGTLPKLVIAAFIWHYLQPIYSTGSAAKLSLDWALPIIMRDLLITFFVAGGWDFLLYSAYSPFYAKMHQFKLNPVYPKASQMRHDMFWSSCSTIISSLFEIALLHLWAVGKLTTTTVPSDKWWTHVPTVAWLITMVSSISHQWCLFFVSAIAEPLPGR